MIESKQTYKISVPKYNHKINNVFFSSIFSFKGLVFFILKRLAESNNPLLQQILDDR